MTPAAHSVSPPMPDLLSQMEIDPAKIGGFIPPQEYLDGLIIPKNNYTACYSAPGSGKSTAARMNGVLAAATGNFTFFGSRQHDRKLRVVMVFAEESEENILQSLSEIPDAIENYRIARAAGTICIISLLDYTAKMAQPEMVFGKEGKTTDFGAELFKSIEKFRPDFFVLDTITAMSDSEYLDGISSRNTISFLNSFCARTKSSGLGFGHTTKGSGGKITSDVSSDDLLSINRGSGMLTATTRHTIVMVPAPKGMYPGIDMQSPGDQLWIGTVKTNLQKCPLAFKVFPIIRDSKAMNLTALSGGGVMADQQAAADRKIYGELTTFLPLLIRAAGEVFHPLAQTGKNSPAELSQGSLNWLFPAGCTKAHVSRAMEDLAKGGQVALCVMTKAGSGNIWDHPSGFYTDPQKYMTIAGVHKMPFFSGSAEAADLHARVEQLQQPGDHPHPMEIQGMAYDAAADAREAAELEAANTKVAADAAAAQMVDAFDGMEMAVGLPPEPVGPQDDVNF